MSCDYSKPWFHGSPLALQELAVGSTITQDKNLARIFSHKPSIVSNDETGNIFHNGKLDGNLYVIDEVISFEDVYLHPTTTMKPGDEWLITRPIKIRKIQDTIPNPAEILTEQEEAELLKQIK